MPVTTGGLGQLRAWRICRPLATGEIPEQEHTHSHMDRMITGEEEVPGEKATLGQVVSCTSQVVILHCLEAEKEDARPRRQAQIAIWLDVTRDAMATDPAAVRSNSVFARPRLRFNVNCPLQWDVGSVTDCNCGYIATSYSEGFTEPFCLDIFRVNEKCVVAPVFRLTAGSGRGRVR